MRLRPRLTAVAVALLVLAGASPAAERRGPQAPAARTNSSPCVMLSIADQGNLTVLGAEGAGYLDQDDVAVGDLSVSLVRLFDSIERKGHSLDGLAIIVRANRAKRCGDVKRVLRACQDLGFQRFALRARTSPNVQKPLPAPWAGKDIRLKLDEKGRVNLDGAAAALDHAAPLLRNKHQTLKAQGTDPGSVVIQLAAAKPVAFETIARVIDLCRAAGFARVNVRREGLPALDRRGEKKLELGADKAGKLTRIRFDGRAYESFKALDEHLRDVYKATGKWPVRRGVLDCDDNLRYEFLIQAVIAVAVTVDDAGKLHSMVEHLRWPQEDCKPTDSPDKLER